MSHLLSIVWSHVTPCFNYLDLTNKMVLLTLPSGSCDAGTGNNTIMTKSVISPCFNCLHLMNKMVPLMTWLVLQDSIAGTNGSTYWKSHVSCHFDHCDQMDTRALLTPSLASQGYA